ncbi:MAG: site-specific integrase [Desulfobacterales bacterium]|nr:site-specific integrase [Desulfobacterales bacterium]
MAEKQRAHRRLIRQTSKIFACLSLCDKTNCRATAGRRVAPDRERRCRQPSGNDSLVDEYLNFLAVERGASLNTLDAYSRDIRPVSGASRQPVGVSSPLAVSARERDGISRGAS